MTEDIFNVSKDDIVFDHMKYILLVCLTEKSRFTVCTFWRIWVFNKIRMCLLLNKYVQYVIGYIRFGPFIDMKKEEWSKKVLLDKLINLVEFILFMSSKFAAICHEYICW